MAVYTKITNDELTEFLRGYDIDQVVSCKGIEEGVENSNYLLRTVKQSYVLTIYEKRVTETDLPFFLELMDYLAKESVPCPTPIHSKSGDFLSSIAKKPAALVSFLDGTWQNEPTRNHCQQVGRALALMHKAGKKFFLHRENTLSLSGWKSLIKACGHRANELKPNWEEELYWEHQYLEKMWPTNLPSGVIHADLFPDNVFFADNNLTGLIDFYFACNDYFAYDIAVCLNAWCFNRSRQFEIKKGEALLAGYQKVRKLSEDEIVNLPILARGAAFRFLLTRLYDWLHQIEGVLVKPRDPEEFWDKLCFHRNIKKAESYGIR